LTQYASPSATASFVPPMESLCVLHLDQVVAPPIISMTRSKTRIAMIRAVVSSPPVTLIRPDGETWI
jgi:hypothetical protein